MSECTRGITAGRTVAVLDPGHLEQTLRSGCGNDTGSTGYIVSAQTSRADDPSDSRAGMRRDMTEPLLPETLHGTVCGSAI